MRLKTIKLKGIEKLLARLSEDELSRLERWLSAELQERDRAKRDRAEGRGCSQGANSPAPAAPILAGLRQKVKTLKQPNTLQLSRLFEREAGRPATPEEEQEFRRIVIDERVRRGELCPECRLYEADRGPGMKCSRCAYGRR